MLPDNKHYACVHEIECSFDSISRLILTKMIFHDYDHGNSERNNE